ncbi:MAG: SDR family oxidoreductase [Gemmatimonadaceae bacterium]|nr:SDR family oxidoreductase [Gemmatimonadaceae bacterium]
MTQPSFDLSDRVAIVTGGYGVLGGSIADSLAGAGVKVALLGRDGAAASAKAADIRATGGRAIPLVADVLDVDRLKAARAEVMKEWGRIDILINAAGGNVPRARSDVRPVFEVPMDAFDEVVRVNLHGSVGPSLVFGESMAEQKRGIIINISSMAAQQAISGVLGYSVAKAGIDSFTRWMAVDMAHRYGEGVRVNAIAPGFFITNQNRDILTIPGGGHTARAETILAHTPMKRFGRPDELNGAIRWLCSDSASFVTGVVLPVDGGFSVFSGV